MRRLFGVFGKNTAYQAGMAGYFLGYSVQSAAGLAASRIRRYSWKLIRRGPWPMEIQIKMLHTLLPIVFSRLFRGLTAVSLAGLASAFQCPDQGPLQNHTDPNFTPCPCFVAGEEFGVVLNIPSQHLPAEILRVRVFAASAVGGQPNVLGNAIHIYGSGLPNPGSPISSLLGPVISDGVQNEFNLEILGGAVPISSNPFTVTFEFATDNVNDFFVPTAVYDLDGCTPGANVIFAIPGGWTDACSLGVPGDWAISVLYRAQNCSSNQTYCLTSANSAGAGAQIFFVGSSGVAANDLVLTCTALPVGQLGLFFYGPNQIQLPFGDGFRCVGGQIKRLGPPNSVDVFGNTARFLDYTQSPMNSGAGLVVPGAVFNFQFWYRDPGFGSFNFNLSNALNVTFTP